MRTTWLPLVEEDRVFPACSGRGCKWMRFYTTRAGLDECSVKRATPNLQPPSIFNLQPSIRTLTVNTLPRPTPSLATVISPPCASTSARAIASPSPVPPVSRARARSVR